MIAGFETPDQGQVYLKGEELTSAAKLVPPQKRGIGFVFQDYALFPHMTALQNVAFGLRNLPRHKKDVFAEEVLCRTGMGRSEEHTSELQSRGHLVCRLLLE